MKKPLLFLIFILPFILKSQSFTLPWQKVNNVPSAPIFCVSNIANEIYVTEEDRVYYSTNSGNTWSTSAALTPSTPSSDDIIAFNGKLYLCTFGNGVFVSTDNGVNWSQMNNGLGSTLPNKFALRNGALYVVTDDNGAYKLNAAGTQWQAFNSGLAGIWGSTFNCVTNYPHGLMAGVSQNGYVLYYEDTATVWKGSYLKGSLSPGLTVFDITYTGNYIWATTNSQVYASNNEGQSWTHVNSGMLNSFFSKLLQVSNTLYVAVNKSGSFYLYKRNIFDPLSTSWTLVDTFTGFECYSLNEAMGKLYVGTSQGLYYLGQQATGVNELITEPEVLNIYPNPAIDHLQWETSSPLKQITIYDLLGKKCMQQEVSLTQKQIDVAQLETGCYYLEAGFENNTVQRKKIIIKK